jgi:hypothetical protein
MNPKGKKNRRYNFPLYVGFANPCQLKVDIEDGTPPFNNPAKKMFLNYFLTGGF